MKTLLLIEDNLDVRENTAEILELANYNVITAENGKIGVAKAKEHIPDLIICDIMMPKLDGYGVLHILSRDAKTRRIPFIFLTALAEKADFRKGMSLGADDYITKPFDETDLLETIERRINKAQMLRQEFETSSKGFQSFVNVAKEIHQLEELSNKYNHVTYPPKYDVFRELDTPKYLYLINDGKVKTSKTNEDGKELITSIYTKGEFLGYQNLFEGNSYNETGTTLEESELTLIPKEDFKNLLYNNREVANRFIQILANNVEEKQERLIELAYNSVRKRIADALIDLQEQYTGDTNQNKYSLDISREDLAQLVGTSKETVIRTLSDFKEQKIIMTKGRYITILDKKILQNI